MMVLFVQWLKVVVKQKTGKAMYAKILRQQQHKKITFCKESLLAYLNFVYLLTMVL